MRSGPTAARACAGVLVVLADVDAVGAARLDEVGAVVEDEQRAVLVRGGAEHRRGLDQARRRRATCRAAGSGRRPRAARRRGRRAAARRRPGTGARPPLARGGSCPQCCSATICASREPAERAERAAHRPPTVEPDPGDAGVGRVVRSVFAVRAIRRSRRRRGRHRPRRGVARGPARPAHARARRGRGRRLALRRGHARARSPSWSSASASCSTSACARSTASRASAPSSASTSSLSGALVVARDRDEAEELEQLYAYRQKLGLAVERLRPSQARRAEPALAPTVRLALDVPGDGAVDPRKLVAALSDAVEAAGGEIRRERVTDPATLPARQVVDRRGRLERQARRAPRPPGQGPDHAPARPPRRGPRHAHHPHARGLSRAARRGPLRARRDGRGARLGHGADRRRHARADPRPRRGACPACSSSRSRSSAPACAPARPTTCR